MNREIKIKIWDKYTKVMSEEFELSELVFDFNVIWTSRFKGQEEISGCDIVFRQFTGIKDKNGIDIYEGDIIKSGSRIMQIVFKQEACQFWMIWKDTNGIKRYDPLTATYGDDTGYFSNDSLEIIGNIHENPELIKP